MDDEDDEAEGRAIADLARSKGPDVNPIDNKARDSMGRYTATVRKDPAMDEAEQRRRR